MTTCPTSYVDLYPSSATAAFGLPEAQVHNYFYDCATGVLKHDIFTSNRGVRTSYSYDVYGRATERIQAAEQSDPAKRTVLTLTFDDGNRIVRTVQDGKLGQVSSFTQLGAVYLARQNADTSTSPIQATGSDEIRSVSMERVEAGVARYALTSNPHFAGVTDSEPTMGWTLRKFDRAGRVVELAQHRGRNKPAPFGVNGDRTGSEMYSYAGETTTVTDAVGNSRSSTIDALGRLKAASDAGVSAAQYQFDVLDNLTLVTQTDSITFGALKTQTRSFGYSSLSRLISATNPEADGPMTYTYYPNGTLYTRTDARGVTATHSQMDGLGRVLKRDYSVTNPVTPSVRFCYDGKSYKASIDGCEETAARVDYAVGALTHVVARRGAEVVSGTEYTGIDPLGRVVGSRQTTAGLEAKAMAYTYAVGGALSSVQYPSGRWVSYEINGANRVSGVRDGQAGSQYYLRAAQYKASGAMASATMGREVANQWTETWEYNSSLQTRKLRVVKGGQKLLGLDWIYGPTAGYDATRDLWEETGSANNGNLRMEKLAHGVGAGLGVDRSYGYDAGNRVASFTEPGKSQGYAYDGFGNMWQTGSTGVPALWANGASWYLLENGLVRNRMQGVGYGAAGNQEQLSVSSGTVASYDAEGRQTVVKVGADDLGRYEYDWEGRRVKQVAGGVTTYFVYDAEGQMLAEYGVGAVEGGARYLVGDRLGSTRMVLKENGECERRVDYAPFGGELERSGQGCYGAGTAGGGKMLFTGKERDGETGLDYFEARYLSSAQGRFTSTDPKSGWPSDPQSWNMYAYGRNNPLLYSDPDGQTYRVCQSGNDGKDTNCTEQSNELTDKQFNQFQKDSKGNMSFSGGKIYSKNDDGSRTQSGTYKQTDVDLNEAGQGLFQGNRQLWNNSAIVGNALGIGLGAMAVLPIAAEIAALPSLEVAVGNNFFGGWHTAFRASGGPWLHGMNLGAEGGAVTVTEAGAARFAGKAVFNFSVKILRPGPVTAMGAGAGAAAGNCFNAACTAFLKGWGLK